MVRIMLRDRPSPRRMERLMYYWLIGKDAGRRVIMGGYESYEAAEMDGFANFQEYEIIPLPTRDRGAAREMIRKHVLDETHNVDETFKRFKHIRREDSK